MDLKELKKEIPHKWRVQSFSKREPVATCVAYVDSRQVQDLLDEVCGAGNWQDEYYEADGLLFCKVGIRINNEWVWKSDTGIESNMSKEKGHSSDAFKRACVKWGIGRFLYSKKIEYVTTNEVKKRNNFPYCIDEKGKKIWDLNKYINQTEKNYKTPFNDEDLFKLLDNKAIDFVSFKKVYKINSDNIKYLDNDKVDNMIEIYHECKVNKVAIEDFLEFTQIKASQKQNDLQGLINSYKQAKEEG